MGTVTKALSLLGYFSIEKAEIGLSDFTRLSGMNKATVYRLLSELQTQGFVEQAGNGRAYRLGPEVLRLAALREATVPILSVTRSVLERLSTITGETAHMSLVQGSKLNAISYAYSSRNATRVMMEDAQVLSFHATGSGLAVLAFADESFVDQILGVPLQAYTPDTLTSAEEVRAKLREIRSVGFAESIGGFEADVHSHAAPVFSADRRPLGALAVAAPMSRVDEAQRLLIRTELLRSARDMTRLIGGFSPPSYPAATAA